MADAGLRFVHGGDIAFRRFLKTWDQDQKVPRWIALITTGTMNRTTVSGLLEKNRPTIGGQSDILRRRVFRRSVDVCSISWETNFVRKKNEPTKQFSGNASTRQKAARLLEVFDRKCAEYRRKGLGVDFCSTGYCRDSHGARIKFICIGHRRTGRGEIN